MGFEERKKGKYERAEKFVEKMKKIQEEAKAALRQAQEDMRKYADKKRSDADEYKEYFLIPPQLIPSAAQIKDSLIPRLSPINLPII